MQGWIKMHRRIAEHEIWSDVTTFRLFTLLMLKASHKDGVKIRGIEINRGEYLRSYSKLAEDLEYKEGRGYKKVAKSTILRSVNKLVDEGMVSVRETEHGTLFTVCKYHEYQGLDSDSETLNETDSEPLAERTQNEDATKTQQEQELKNLRTKELITTTTEPPAQDSMSADDFQKRLLSRFVELRAYGFTHSPKDEMAAAEIKQSGVPIEMAIKTLEEVFSNYKPKHSRDRINALSYCVGPILDKHTRPAATPQKSEEQQKQDQEYDYGF